LPSSSLNEAELVREYRLLNQDTQREQSETSHERTIRMMRAIDTSITALCLQRWNNYQRSGRLYDRALEGIVGHTDSNGSNNDNNNDDSSDDE